MINPRYRAGYAARQAGKEKQSCPFAALTPFAAWWLAGWHDADIEIIGKENAEETKEKQ
jgi:ribosome modulation factor